MLNIPFLLSLSPFVVFVLLLLWKKMSLLKVSVITLILITVLALVYWQIIPNLLAISYAKGFFVALDIFIIIAGAIFFLEILKDLKIIDSISYHLELFSKDYRVQVIILAWLFENFLEGTAGFGTPAAVVAPILVSLGVSPLMSVIIALLGNSTAGIFGAAGTPIRVGFAGLDISAIPFTAAVINCIGFLIPVFMLWILTANKKDRWQQFTEALPFAIWTGLAFVIPSVLVVPLGQEFPSILGSVIGLILIFISTRFGIFMPRKIRTLRTLFAPAHAPSFIKDLFPYALLIILLIAGKIFIGSSGIAIPAIKHAFGLFNPGFAFIITGIIIAYFWHSKKAITLSSAKDALHRALAPFLVIVSMSAMVQIMINSGQNYSGLSSSIALIAKSFETTLLPFIAPFVGAFGSFITGSVTISNILFGNFLNLSATAIQMDSVKILSLAIVGAAAGNMVALADILSAEAVVGLKNHERQVLKGVIIPCLIYLVLTGIIGLLII